MALRLRAGQFYGGQTRTLDINGFRLSERCYQNGLNTPVHAHEFAHFCYVLAGGYTERLERRGTEDRVASALVWYPPGVAHAEKHHAPGRHLIIEINQDKAKEWGVVFKGPALALKGSANRYAGQLCSEFRNADVFSHLAIEGILLELVAAVCRAHDKETGALRPRWLARVEQVLQENCINPPSLTELARIAGVHPIHLSRTFRRWHKSSIGAHIRQLRIEQAVRIIGSSHEPLIQVALATGFADQSHFAKSFKRVIGMTPTQFRSLHQR